MWGRRRFDGVIERILDALASRLVLFILVGVVIAQASIGVEYVRRAMSLLEEAETIISGPSIRHGAISAADLYRVTSISNEAAGQGGFDAERLERFGVAVDILYVRAETLRGVYAGDDAPPDAAAAIALLYDVIAIADRALTGDLADIRAFAAELSDVSAIAQSKLNQFFEDQHTAQSDAFDETFLALGGVAGRHSTFVLINVVVGLTALSLLRREVVARRARAAAEVKLAHLAYHDSLTDLKNRAYFNEQLEARFGTQANLPRAGPPGDRRRDWRDWTLIYVDLDDFKQINDVHGHQAGDQVLRHVARALGLIGFARAGVAARLAGDEFALLVPVSDVAELERLGRRIVYDAGQPVIHGNARIEPGLSVGMVAARHLAKSERVTPLSLSRAADFALYEAKRRLDPDPVQIFDDSLSTRMMYRRDQLEALGRAIDQGDLEVWLQPKVALATGRHTSFEALVRWRHNGNIVMPGEFISLAEESGAIVAVDRFMLYAATAEVAAWNLRHDEDVSVSVNLSELFLASPQMEDCVADAIARSGLRPDQLILELTESVEVRDWATVSARLNRLRASGCRVSLDDFGTGYSSLGYLRQMPADELKLDKSFIVDLETAPLAQEIIAAVVNIAQTLRLDVVAEGIETPNQAQIVQNLGCTIGQGYFFGRPKPARQWGPQLSDALEPGAAPGTHLGLRQGRATG